VGILGHKQKGYAMTEIIVRGLGIFACGILWRLGGDERYPKAIRRYGCPAVIVGINMVFNFSWIGLIAYPTLAAAFSLGYGINSTLTKLLKNGYLVRGVCGLLYSLAALPILYTNTYAMIFHILLTTSFVCLSGNQKFQYNDKREEAGIGIITGLMPLL
jgi:hypothetical protein